MKTKDQFQPKILAVSSAGGHWIQLQRFRPVLEKYQTVYASTCSDNAATVHPAPFYTLTDATRWNKWIMVKLFFEVVRIIIIESPNIIITTGAAPGLWAVIAGKVSGARTIWVDSMANAEKLSMCGTISRYFTNLHLTQWPHLAGKRTRYAGQTIS